MQKNQLMLLLGVAGFGIGMLLLSIGPGDKNSGDQPPVVVNEPVTQSGQPPVNSTSTTIQEDLYTGTTAQALATNTGVSLLAQYAGFGHNPDADEAKYSAEELERETLVADCMQQSGFEYQPTPSIVLDDAMMENEADFERLLQEAAIDPNESYVNSLSSELRKVYYVTLVGMEDPNNPEGSAHDQAAANDSCYGRAFEAVPGVYAGFNAVREAVDQMQQDIESDTRVATAKSRWSNCMKNKGHQYAEPMQIRMQEDQLLEFLLDGGDVDSTSDNLDPEIIAALAEPDRNESIARIQQHMDLLGQVAGACNISAGLDQSYERVAVEYENQFYEQHKETLSKFAKSN